MELGKKITPNPERAKAYEEEAKRLRDSADWYDKEAKQLRDPYGTEKELKQ